MKSKANGSGDANVLHPDPRNVRKHPPRNQELIRQSLQEIGPFRSIGADGENIIRAGNGVYEQAVALGLKTRIVDADPDELIVVRRKDLKGEKAERAALFDNRASDTSANDAAQLLELAEHNAELLDGIFTPDELMELEAEAQLAWDRGDGPGYDSMRDIAQRAKFLELVIAVNTHEPIERALSKAQAEYHCERGEAMVKICETYLKSNSGKNGKG